MPINTSLNIDPYFDDYDISKKYYRVLFKPRYAVQARELTQLQTTLQNQIEQFGDNIYKEGSIIKGCNFTELSNLRYVKVADGISPSLYLQRTEEDTNTDTIYQYYYELENNDGLKAYVVTASDGYQSRAPDLNTFFINYTSTSNSGVKSFVSGESLSIREKVIITELVNGNSVETIADNGVVGSTTVATFSNPVGSSYGLSVSEGITFQKGHFLYSDEQTIVVSKYVDLTSEIREPNQRAVGFVIDEEIITSQQDTSLFDNANGSPNENAPGADRLKLSPRLIALDTSIADADATFFALRRYENGNAIQIRDVSQFNSIATEMAKRTYETNGDYITNPFKFGVKRRSNGVNLTVGSGVIYSKGYRVENKAERSFLIDEIASDQTKIQNNQPITFEYGGYCNVLAATGVVNIENFSIVRLLDQSETEIGNAVIKNYNGDRIYLFAIRMDGNNNFSDVVYVKDGTGNTGLIEIEPRVRNSADSKLIFDTGMFSIKSVNDFTFNIRRQQSNVAVNSSGELTVLPEPSETFNSYTLNNVLVINQNFEQLEIQTSAITEQGNLFLEVNDADTTATVYYNAQITPDSAKVKQTFDVFVKVYYTQSANKFTLGLPDVYDILSITGSDSVDYTDSFRLNNNQKDNFYDHSYVSFINGRKEPTEGELLTVKLKVFKVDFSENYNFFTVNSYPNISLDKIPYFESATGKIMDMRNCIDFRPYRTAIASYSTNLAGATSIAPSTPIDLPEYSEQIFNTSINYAVPECFASGSADFEYFLNRTDALVVDSYGNFNLVKGTSGLSSAPTVDRDKTVIAEIYIPGYPILTQEEASIRNKMSYGVKIKPKGIENYTMKEINDLAKTISRLTYYASVSSLESSAQNLLIQDENGLNRFKNGIVVDPFNDLSIANVKDPEFNASVDFTEKSLAPAVKTIPFNLIFNAAESDSVQVFNNKVVTLAPNLSENDPAARIISQPYATNSRNCISNFFFFKGTGFLTPEYDGAYDVNTDPVQLDLDLFTPFSDLVDGINEFIPLTSTSSSLISSSTSTTTDSWRTGGLFGTGLFSKNRSSSTNVTTDVFQDVTRTLQVLETSNEQSLGDFVTNVQFQPYMRSREIEIVMHSLRPNTRHYFFFDEIDINEFVAPASSTGELNRVSRSGEYGDIVSSDVNGTVRAVFLLPENTFFVGDRIMYVADVDSFDNINSASISRGTLTYRAYNFDIQKTGLTVATRIPEIDIDEVVTTRTVTTREVAPIILRERDDSGQNFDPLAQTFFIKNNMSGGGECIYASSIDLYFKRKSSTNGVTVMLREVSNGYPAKEILPFSKIHLAPTDVIVSENGSSATNIVFDAPVRLNVEKEYCVVVMPDGNDPDYLIYTSKIGGTDLITGSSVVQDWGDGVLFTSTNNRAWQSYQDEDIKFNLYRYNFNASTGSAVFETEPTEFLGVTNAIGKFRLNENVYAIKGTDTYTVTLVAGSNIGTGTNLGSFNAGEYIYVMNGSGTENLLKIASATTTQLTFANTPSFSATVSAKPAVVGSVAYFNYREPDNIILENSSARENFAFEVGDVVYGIYSGARATITGLNDFRISYMQTMLNKITDTYSTVNMSGLFIDPAYPTDIPYAKELQFGESERFNERGALLRSKSNPDATNISAKIVMNMSNNGLLTSTPFVDLETGMSFVYQYKVGNTSEKSAKYISKKVQLSEGFVSEDFNIYVTAHRPNGTDIKAYIRPLNESDPSALYDNDWIEMIMVNGAETYTSTTNLNDFREYAFEIPSTQKDIDGVTQYTNNNGTFTGFRTFDLKIELLSENVDVVPRLLDYRGVAFE